MRLRIAGSARVLNNRKDARMAAVAADCRRRRRRLAQLKRPFSPTSTRS